MLCAGLAFVAGDVVAKVAASKVGVVDLIWGRNAAYLLVVVVVAGRSLPSRVKEATRVRIHVARGVAMFATTSTLLLALSLLPLAEVNTLASATPLFTVALAGLLIGERVTRSSIAGAVIGFIGVVVLVGIDPANVEPAVLIPLATAASFSIFGLLTRALRSESPDVTMFFSGAIGLIGASILLYLGPAGGRAGPSEWLLVAVVGLLSYVAHRLLVGAYGWGRASDLAPLSYIGLIWSFVLGAAVFGEPVEVRAVIGALAIAIGGLVALRSLPTGSQDVLPQ